MPGYELARFVEASATELKNLTCRICQEIFCHPVVTNCCYETFCESCIKPWIESNHTCPSDYKPLKQEGLMAPAKLLVKLLNKQKIKCGFEEKGCNEVVTVANIETHEKSCPADKEPCKVCSLASRAEHDCLKALIEHKKMMSTTMDKLCLEMDEAEMQSRNLRSQIDNFTKILKALSLERTRLAYGVTRVHNNKDLLAEARKHINSPIVEGHQTRKEVVDKVFEVVKEAINNRGDRSSDVVRYVKDMMDGNCMGDWNVYLLYANIGFVCHNVLPDAFVEIKLGKVNVTVFKSFDSLAFSRLVGFIKAGAVRDFALSKTGFEDKTTREIEKVTLTSLRASADLNEFTDKVTVDLMAHFGGIWNCFVYKNNFGFYSVRADKGRLCLLSGADVKILLFQ